MVDLFKKKILLKPLIADILASPFVLASSFILSQVRKFGITNMPISRKIFQKVGVFPILDNYYEPMFNPAHLKKSLREDRVLMGLDFNVIEQLKLLDMFNFNEELVKFPIERLTSIGFFYHNGFFESGDAEYLYNIIRFFKPNRIIEIGSGYSTLMAQNAIKENKKDDYTYICEHICIEPYSNPWLDKLDITLIRNIAENVDKKIFETLKQNDILFIDSSHMIRPQGDVLFEYLEVLPILKPGVLVHVHDIFTPKDYPDEWVIDEIRFWNEQYLLEAFLSFNKDFRIIGALNYLRHNYPDRLASKCPIFEKEIDFREPGSLWMVRT